jgi:hypothetical protein
LNFGQLSFGPLNFGELNLGELRRKRRHDCDHNVASTPCHGMKSCEYCWSFGEKGEVFAGAGLDPKADAGFPDHVVKAPFKGKQYDDH